VDDENVVDAFSLISSKPEGKKMKIRGLLALGLGAVMIAPTVNVATKSRLAALPRFDAVNPARHPAHPPEETSVTFEPAEVSGLAASGTATTSATVADRLNEIYAKRSLQITFRDRPKV
jgi:hypothetical protein